MLEILEAKFQSKNMIPKRCGAKIPPSVHSIYDLLHAEEAGNALRLLEVLEALRHLLTSMLGLSFKVKDRCPS